LVLRIRPKDWTVRPGLFSRDSKLMFAGFLKAVRQRAGAKLAAEMQKIASRQRGAVRFFIDKLGRGLREKPFQCGA